jgi:hypothetical protein
MEYREALRYQLIGIHNPVLSHPLDYESFDFACTPLSQPQLRDEVRSLDVLSPEFNQVLFKNTLLKASGNTTLPIVTPFELARLGAENFWTSVHLD